MKIPCNVAVFIYLFIFKFVTLLQATTEDQSENLMK